jgi:hypothetical protein
MWKRVRVSRAVDGVRRQLIGGNMAFTLTTCAEMQPLLARAAMVTVGSNRA